MSNVRVMNSNYLDPSIRAGVTSSSAQTNFPLSNLDNAQRRSKVWRSNGNWDVVGGSNTIVFQETAGVDLTATVAAGNYSSTTLFLAAIKSALEAAGGGIRFYTASQDPTTLKITITANSASGHIFSLRWSVAGSAGMAALLGFNTASDQTGALTYTADTLKIHTSEWIRWDLGLSSNPTSLLLIGPRNRAINISPTATIKIQANPTDVWTSPAYEATLTYDTSVISLFNSAGLADLSYRYWRLYIQDQSNAKGYVELGYAYMGSMIEPSRGSVQFPLNASLIDRSETVFAEGGQSFTDIRQKSEQFSLDWFGLTVSEKETIDSFFNTYGTGIPFFIALDPQAAFSSVSSKFIRYCKFSKEPTWALISPTNFTMKWEIREEL